MITLYDCVSQWDAWPFRFMIVSLRITIIMANQPRFYTIEIVCLFLLPTPYRQAYPLVYRHIVHQTIRLCVRNRDVGHQTQHTDDVRLFIGIIDTYTWCNNETNVT